MKDAMYLKNEKLVYYVMHREFPDYEHDEDMLQEARMALWKACLNYRPEVGKFSTYAYRAICNGINKQFRTNKRSAALGPVTSLDNHVSGDDSLTTLSDVTPAHESEWDTAEARELDDILKRVLTKEEQELCHLLMSGMSQQDVADMYGLSRQGVGGRVLKIRSKLKAYGMLND